MNFIQCLWETGTRKKIGISEGMEAFPKSRKSYGMLCLRFYMQKSQQSWFDTRNLRTQWNLHEAVSNNVQIILYTVHTTVHSKRIL
jgi:hypothetical protein